MFAKSYMLFWFLLSVSLIQCSSTDGVRVHKDGEGWKLLVNGDPMIVNGMNWDYFPIGTNYEYSIWEESDDFIAEALDYEMSLLKDMGVNAIRVYTGIQARWIEYIYVNFGIYTMLNHPFGRYGYSLNGNWKPNTDYSDPRAREILIGELKDLAREYKGTPGLLLYLLGNENNYGLFWSGAETEDVPEVDEEYSSQARYMYSLFNEGALAIKSIDSQQPVAFCNGDLLFLDLIVEECPDVDIFGINVYRGKSFTYLFEKAAEEYDKPLLLTEFGSDAFNSITGREAQMDQAAYNLANWEEIYANASGMGKAGNSIGGFTFQFSDGWWKYGQNRDLDVHNTEASWENAGYEFDHLPGKNNMNEEWFGVCAKGPVDENGFYSLQPRAAYFVLQQAHQFNPYAEDASVETLRQHFSRINVGDLYEKAKIGIIEE